MAMTNRAPSHLVNESLPIPELIDAVVLGADSAESYTVPVGTNYVVISADNPVWVCVAGTAAVPTDEIADGSGVAYISTVRSVRVEQGSVLSIIRVPSTATVVTIGRYS